eukprot:391248-Pelagomonas_calceolata.AAC.5
MPQKSGRAVDPAMRPAPAPKIQKWIGLVQALMCKHHLQSQKAFERLKQQCKQGRQQQRQQSS